MNRAWIEVKVARKVVEAVDVVSLELVPTKGANLPPFSAGLHIDVELPNGLIRQYSLCNDALETHRYQVACCLTAVSVAAPRACTMTSSKAARYASASREITSHSWLRIGPFCLREESVLRPSCAWPSGFSARVPSSRCITARVPAIGLRSSSALSRRLSRSGWLFTLTTVRHRNVSMRGLSWRSRAAEHVTMFAAPRVSWIM